MKYFSVLLALALLAAPEAHAQHVPASDRDAVRKIITAATSDSAAWNRLALWTDTFGHRLSGSESLEHAIDWALAELNREGMQHVRGEPVLVPHWVRGEESATLIEPRRLTLHMLGLGGSIGTPAKGITAPVLVVTSFDELARRAGDARGKIVLFDAPFTSYDETVKYRARGASAAAKVGAVAALVRSIASGWMRNPHTGALSYDSTAPRIPAAALSVEDAMLLHRMANRGQRIVVTLAMQAKTLPDAPSRNIVAELVGSEHPEEIVVIGGHIDSWDVGQGAMDDAGGFMAAWEALNVIKRLGLHPKRTIRLVGWTNEENGTRGAKGYRDAHTTEIGKHVLAIESDGGVFRPLGVTLTGESAAIPVLREIAALLAPVGATVVDTGEAEADVDPLVDRGVPALGLKVDMTRYFWYHHSEADTPDKLDPADVARCVAVMATYAYVAANMPERLPGRKAGSR